MSASPFCDRCGQFIKPDEIEAYEQTWTGAYGELFKKDGFIHKDLKCPERANK